MLPLLSSANFMSLVLVSYFSIFILSDYRFYFSEQLLSLSLSSVLFLDWLVPGSLRGFQDSKQLLIQECYILGPLYVSDFLPRSQVSLNFFKIQRISLPRSLADPLFLFCQSWEGQESPGELQTQPDTVPGGSVRKHVLFLARTGSL